MPTKKPQTEDSNGVEIKDSVLHRSKIEYHTHVHHHYPTPIVKKIKRELRKKSPNPKILLPSPAYQPKHFKSYEGDFSSLRFFTEFDNVLAKNKIALNTANKWSPVWAHTIDVDAMLHFKPDITGGQERKASHILLLFRDSTTRKERYLIGRYKLEILFPDSVKTGALITQGELSEFTNKDPKFSLLDARLCYTVMNDVWGKSKETIRLSILSSSILSEKNSRIWISALEWHI